jgi:hypothetical protein
MSDRATGELLNANMPNEERQLRHAVSLDDCSVHAADTRDAVGDYALPYYPYNWCAAPLPHTFSALFDPVTARRCLSSL